MEYQWLIPTIPVACVRAKDRTGKRIVMRERYASALILPLSGKIEFTQNGRSVTADADHPVFLPKGCSYVNRCLEDADSLMINMNVPDAPGNILVLPAADSSEALRTFERMSLLAENGAPVQRVLSELLALIGNMLDTSAADNDPLQGAIRRMLRDYADPALSVSDLAGTAHLSPSWFRQLFLRRYGCTPLRYLTQLRMHRALQLLREGRAVKEVALSVGYADVYQFSRAFRRQYGCPPSRYDG